MLAGIFSGEWQHNVELEDPEEPYGSSVFPWQLEHTLKVSVYVIRHL